MVPGNLKCPPKGEEDGGYLMENYNLMFWHMKDALQDTLKHLEQIQRWDRVGEEDGRKLETLQRDINMVARGMAGIVWRRS